MCVCMALIERYVFEKKTYQISLLAFYNLIFITLMVLLMDANWYLIYSKENYHLENEGLWV